MDDQRMPELDLPTLVGLVLLLAPLLTMLHEIGGHATMCLATGGRLTEIGAHYVDCESHGPFARRLVSLAGTGMDVCASLVFYLIWRTLRPGLARIALWMAFVDKALVAAGYPAFSGVSGIGDWGVSGDGGLAPLAPAWAWRIGFTLLGAGSYYAVIRIAIRMLDDTIGRGLASMPARKRVALTLYLATGLSAVTVGLLNPVGLSITLASSAASSFGGLAGLFTVAFTPPRDGAPLPLRIGRNWPLIAIGAACTAAFAVILGPSIRLG